MPVAFNLKRLLRLSNEYSALMMMIIAPNSRAHKGKKERGDVKEEYEGVCGEEERNADYGGMVQPSQQHVAPCVKVVE